MSGETWNVELFFLLSLALGYALSRGALTWWRWRSYGNQSPLPLRPWSARALAPSADCSHNRQTDARPSNLEK